MKRLSIYFLMACAFAAGSTASAQNPIKVKQDTYALIGDSVHVEMTIDLSNAKINRNAYIILTPTIKSDKATVDMPSVVINGRTQHKIYNRLITLKKGPEYIYSEINAGDKNAPRTYKYTTTLPYELWMADAAFIVREEQCDCNGAIVPTSLELMAKTMEDRNPPPPPPYKDVEMNFAVSYIIPNPEPVKARSETGKAYLDFPAGKSVLNPDFGNNAAELSKIGDLIRKVKNDPFAKITKISIEGYASPEGSAKTNQTLSTNRAAALKNNLRNSYGFRESELKVTGRGEDWTGFTKLMEESTLPQKDQIMTIVNNSKPADTKERELRALSGGVFKTLSDEYFPKLRRTDYELSYVIIPLTVEQSKELLKTAPRNLSLNEMFLVAESYPKGSEEYNEVFEIAARVFPDNEISTINAAANALARNDVATAEKFLSKIKNRNAAFHNNMGVMCSLKGDYDKAMIHFSTAKEYGSKEAELNAGEIEKMKQVEKELISK